jgi:hypothetical protein
MSAVSPLIAEIGINEPKCSGARDLKNHVVGGVVPVLLLVKVCLALHEKTSDIKMSLLRGKNERSVIIIRPCVNVCAVLHEKTSDIKMSKKRRTDERSETTDNRN